MKIVLKDMQEISKVLTRIVLLKCKYSILTVKCIYSIVDITIKKYKKKVGWRPSYSYYCTRRSP
jgi:hypothetical protein